MDDLDAALKNYRKAFNTKLDAYQSNVFPLVDEEVLLNTKPTKKESLPITEPQTEPKYEKEKKKTPTTTADKSSRQEPKSDPIKTKSDETIGKTTSTETQNEKENETPNTHETIQDAATEDENTTTETLISTPENDKPPIEPIIIQRHIIHRTIHSVSFRLSIGLILLLLL
jgi:hypothetical protein